MDIAKIRIKIGDHEFEAEGPSEIVKAQFETFKQLLETASSKPLIAAPAIANKDKQNQHTTDPIAHVPLEKVLRVSGRVVSLTAIPASTEDAALLIMLGHKDLRNNESVTGQELGDGLSLSGRPVPRTDRLMDKPIVANFVLKTGYKRSVRYRLTNLGHQKALAVARELIASLPK
jgi:hypothetical protein